MFFLMLIGHLDIIFCQLSVEILSFFYQVITDTVLPSVTMFLFPFYAFYYSFFLNFVFSLYSTVLVLPYIDMNPPQGQHEFPTLSPSSIALRISSLWVIPVRCDHIFLLIMTYFFQLSLTFVLVLAKPQLVIPVSDLSSLVSKKDSFQEYLLNFTQAVLIKTYFCFSIFFPRFFSPTMGVLYGGML